VPLDVRKALDVFRQWEQLKTTRSSYEPLWQELARFVAPRKSNILTKLSPGMKFTSGLFDSTAIKANEDLAASIAGALTNPASRWFRLKMRNELLNQDRDTQLWLLICSDHLYLAFAQSNFHAEQVELYQDLGAFGVAAKFVDEREVMGDRFGGLRFKTLFPGEYWVSENSLDQVDTLYRTFSLSAAAVQQRFGQNKEGLGKTVTKHLESKPYEMVDILHAVFPRHESLSEDQVWMSGYYVVEDKHLLERGLYYEFPFMVPRWAKRSGEVYGRGPAHIALPDVKTLNKAKELALRSWAKAIDPPLLTLDDGVIGNLNLVPSGTTSVRQMDAVMPLEMRSRFDISAVKEEELRRSIKEIFFNHQLQLPQKNYMTATEVEAVLEQMYKILGPTVGRLENEDLTPTIHRSFALLARAGVLPPPPPIVQAALQAGEEVDVEYEGPLTRAQRTSGLQSLERFYAGLAGIAQVDPTSIDMVDHDEAVREIAGATGVTPSILRDPRKVEEIRQGRQAQQQALQQEQQTLNMAETVNKLAPAMQAAQGLIPQQGAGTELPTSGSGTATPA
jgi:head-to-tail connecting protein